LDRPLLVSQALLRWWWGGGGHPQDVNKEDPFSPIKERLGSFKVIPSSFIVSRSGDRYFLRLVCCFPFFLNLSGTPLLLLSPIGSPHVDRRCFGSPFFLRSLAPPPLSAPQIKPIPNWKRPLPGGVCTIRCEGQVNDKGLAFRKNLLPFFVSPRARLKTFFWEFPWPLLCFSGCSCLFVCEGIRFVFRLGLRGASFRC